MQRVQTYARVAFPSRNTRTRCRFGLKRRLVATMEWLRLWPNEGFFPQIAQTLDTAAECSDSGRCGAGRRPELGEDVGHLERGASRLGALVEPLARLLLGVGGQHAERDRNARLQARELEPARRLARDELEVRRLAADDRAESDDARVAARLRQRHRGQRQLECARHG